MLLFDIYFSFKNQPNNNNNNLSVKLGELLGLRSSLAIQPWMGQRGILAGCASSCCAARGQNASAGSRTLVCEGLNGANVMLDKDVRQIKMFPLDRNSPQKCYEIPCEPALKKVARALTCLLTKQHVLRARPHDTSGAKATASLRRTTDAGEEVPLGWMWYVSICSNQSNTSLLISFPSFFPLLPSLSLFSAVAVTCKSKLPKCPKMNPAVQAD